MTSLAMALNTFNETMNGKTINPETFNSWLIDNGGYVDENLLVWAAGNPLGSLQFLKYYSGYGSLPTSQFKSIIDNGDPVIVNVREGSHWVLVIGYQNSEIYYVNDPGFSNTFYNYSSMGNFIVYNY